MGFVYRAEHTYLGRTAAVKILEPRLTEDSDYLSRFMHEAKIVSALQHPNIVEVFDFIETEGPRRVAFVMELLDGSTLAELLAQRALSWDETISASLQLCRALAAVHARGVVHRDLKPDNVMVVGPLAGRPGSKPSLKLLDFGIAKASEPRAGHQTATGVMMGTPTYMAPEQFAAEPTTPATDVYALAELIYEMLTQKPAFAGRGLPMMRRKMSGVPPELELPGTAEHPETLRRLLQDCLQVGSDLRPSIVEVEKALLSLHGSPGRAAAPVRSALSKTKQVAGLRARAAMAGSPRWSSRAAWPSGGCDHRRRPSLRFRLRPQRVPTCPEWREPSSPPSSTAKPR